MTIHHMRSSFLFAGTILTMDSPVIPQPHVVELKSDGSAKTRIATPLLRIQPGDKVKFIADEPGFSCASKPGMIPSGAAAWESCLDDGFEFTFSQEGTYGYVCQPGYKSGTVGLILVGSPYSNLEIAKKIRHPAKAGKAFRGLFDALDA